jgi:peptidoglycan/LPS O-acetylase OafA/YrhL
VTHIDLTTQDTEPSIADQVPHTRVEGKSKNIQIQWLRALAATMVVLFHATVYQSGSKFSVFDPRFGVFGVALFFAISGYLMAVAIARQDAFVFLAHRVLRIYPLFLGVCFLYYAVAWLLKMPVPIDRSALSLFPVDSANYPLTVEWTLIFEISFYMALFVIGAIGLGRYIVWIAAAWLAYLAIASWHTTDSVFLITTILRVAQDAPFAGGLLIPFLARLRLPPFWLIGIGLLLFLPLCGFIPATDSDIIRWLAALSAVMVLTGVITLSQSRPNFGDNMLGRAFARVGDYSYALYLCHAPVLRFMAHITGYDVNLLWGASIAVAVILSIVLGEADIRLYAYSKKALATANPALRNALVLAFAGSFFFVSGFVVYAWYTAQSLKPFAASQAAAIAAFGPITTPAEAAAAALRAGLVKSDHLVALVEKTGWAADYLQVQGWALDRGKHHLPVALAYFQGGVLLGSDVASINRPDVNKVYRTRMMTSFDFKAKTPCYAREPVVVLAFAADKTFTVVENTQPPLACAP